MSNILPIILNTNFEKLCILDDYISLIWSTRYYTCGDFELCVGVNNKSKKHLLKDYYIMREDDGYVGIIENIKIQRSESGQEMIIVTGRFLSSILGRRIIEKQTTVSGVIDTCIETLVDENAISPTDSDREIPNLTFTSSITQTTKMEAQYTGKNLLDTISGICETYGVGFKTSLTNDNKFAFELFEGVDRSYNQNVNPYVVFSDEYDNLLSSEYEENYQDIVTNVLVAGEGEGLERRTLWVTNDDPSGLARYEGYKDHRDIRSKTDEGELTDEEYNKLLKEAGLEELVEFTQLFTGTVYFGSVEYKKDVFIGDICTIENSRWGLYINARLVEVIESVGESGEYSIVPTFAL